METAGNNEVRTLLGRVKAGSTNEDRVDWVEQKPSLAQMRCMAMIVYGYDSELVSLIPR